MIAMTSISHGKAAIPIPNDRSDLLPWGFCHWPFKECTNSRGHLSSCTQDGLESPANRQAGKSPQLADNNVCPTSFAMPLANFGVQG